MSDLEEATRLLAKNVNLEAIGGTLQTELQSLKKAADDGELSWSVASVIAGGLLAVSGCFGLASSVVYLSPFSFVLNLYIMAFGVLFIILEYKQRVFTKHYLSLIRSEALFLTRPYGRALFYIFVGVLVVCSGGWVNLFVGKHAIYCKFPNNIYAINRSVHNCRGSLRVLFFEESLRGLIQDEGLHTR